MQFSSNERDPPPHPAPTPTHAPQRTTETVRPKKRPDTATHTTSAGNRKRQQTPQAPVPSGPNSVPGQPHPAGTFHPTGEPDGVLAPHEEEPAN